MRIDIDNIFSQIINMQISDSGVQMLKDIQLDLKEEYQYDISMSYIEAYSYLCDCLLMYDRNNDSQSLLDLFLVHQYLCYCYLSKDAINHLFEDSDDWEATVAIIEQCFFIYRLIGAFQTCVKQYEILRESEIWQKLQHMEKMQIMKESAKSYRNIGHFYQALKLYYECLKLTPKQDWLQRVELLLKIGKVYRNYLMQIELARFFVEEAYAIIEENKAQVLNKEKSNRYAIICLDSLGQIYRDKKDYVKAEGFFKKSKEMYGKKGGRAQIHEILMKYKKNRDYSLIDLHKDIEFLVDVITDLERNPIEAIGVGVRSVQLGSLKYKDELRDKKEAYNEVYKGRAVAYRYNNIKTVIRSYIQEAEFYRQEKRYRDYIKVSKFAIKLASDSNQLVLENAIIKEIIELSNNTPDIVDSATKIELIKRRKDIYNILMNFSKFSIDIVRNSDSFSFSKDKLVDVYKIVLDDFEQIFDELNKIIEILNIEIDNINQKYIAYLNTEIKGFTYKNILHKLMNGLPDEHAINRLRLLCDDIQLSQLESREILVEANKQLETFANIITHIKQSAKEALQESKYEKEWCSLDTLIRTGIQNFLYLKQKYEKNIQYNHAGQAVEVFVQSTLFETTISEILNNAFDYVETVTTEDNIKEYFEFHINSNLEKKFFVMECYSEYWDNEAAREAEISIRKGWEGRQSTKKTGSKFGFYSMKVLFEDLLGGKIEVMLRENLAGISIHLPINLVTLRFEKESRIYG